MLVIKCKGFLTKAELLQAVREQLWQFNILKDVYEVVIEDHTCKYPTASLVFPWVNTSGRHKCDRSTTQATGSADCSAPSYITEHLRGARTQPRGAPPYKRQKSRLGRNTTATVQSTDPFWWRSPGTSKAANSSAARNWVRPFPTQRDSNPPGWPPQQPETSERASSLKVQHCPLLVRARSRFCVSFDKTPTKRRLQEACIWTRYAIGPHLVRTVNISHPRISHQSSWKVREPLGRDVVKGTSHLDLD